MEIRPDLAYIVFILNRYCLNPESLQLKTLDRVFRYIKSTLDLNIHYDQRSDGFINYIDIDYIGILNGRRFIGGYVFMFYNESIL